MDYLDCLNPEQKQAVVHEGSPLLILAGAGSGKTRVITTKIAYLIQEKKISPYSILSVTFTKKAANEMKERAVALESEAAKCQIRTFHSFGSWFLRRYSEFGGVEKNFTVYDDSDMATIVKNACPGLTAKEANFAAHQISLAKDYCLTPDDDLSFIGSEFDINSLYADYEKRLRATGNVDFGDLIMLPVKILERNQEIASEIHNRFNVIMVDEYQDSNIAQYKLLQKISGIDENCNNYVCVVGDDDQSIYHFRGAEVQNILTFPDKFPGTQIIRLERNYRSTEKILNAASAVVKKNTGRLGKTLIAERGDGNKPVLTFLPDQNSEAVFCADLISKSVANGAQYSDWALLYRTNAQSVSFEKEFITRRIPYKIIGSLKFFEREEIKDALAYLGLFANPKDEISFRRIVNKPSRGIGEKTQNKILEAALNFNTDENKTDVDSNEFKYNDLIEESKKMAPSLSKKAREGIEAFTKLFDILKNNFTSEKKLSDFIELIINDSGLLEYHKSSDAVEGTTRAENLQELINTAENPAENDHNPYLCSLEDLSKFLDAINLDRTLDRKNDEEAGDNFVTLITLHNTKGLEYNRVIITGLEDGIFPRNDKQGADLEEERRLFYVGITRAKDELFITSVEKRCLYGCWQYMRPSQFLKDTGGLFTVIGNVPLGFSTKQTYSGPSFGKQIDSSFMSKSGFGNEAEDFGDKSEIAEKWKKGTKIYHDDYGYGVIVSGYMSKGEYVIETRFENGGKMKFQPEYQKKLEIIK